MSGPPSSSMYLAYNTNGLAHHRLEDAVRMLADLGYGGVALTPDVPHLDLRATGPDDWSAFRQLLEDLGLRCVVETGARYVLDPRRKHWPNLVTADESAAQRRLEYYADCCRLAQGVGANLISLWSGAPEPGTSQERAWELLEQRLPHVLDSATERGVVVALEPEPGMLVGDLASYRELRRRLGRDDLATTLDVGHLLATEPGQPADHLEEFQATLRNVQLDDGHRGVHEHLPIGEGEIDFASVLRQLRAQGYSGPLGVELSRDSHRAAQIAEDAFRRLSVFL